MQVSRKHAERLIMIAVACLAVLLWWWLQDGSGSGSGSEDPTPPSSGATVQLADLPPEARETARLIEQGGPFPYERDGVTFRNDEGLLPDQDRGFYQEYTVPTPGSDDRGAHRLVFGGGTMYYTDDHYRSFRRIEGSS